MRTRIFPEVVNGVTRFYPQKKFLWWWTNFAMETPNGFFISMWFTTNEKAAQFLLDKEGVFK